MAAWQSHFTPTNCMLKSRELPEPNKPSFPATRHSPRVASQCGTAAPNDARRRVDPPPSEESGHIRTPIHTKKRAPESMKLGKFKWCGEGDLNPHEIAPAS